MTEVSRVGHGNFAFVGRGRTSKFLAEEARQTARHRRRRAGAARAAPGARPARRRRRATAGRGGAVELRFGQLFAGDEQRAVVEVAFRTAPKVSASQCVRRSYVRVADRGRVALRRRALAEGGGDGAEVDATLTARSSRPSRRRWRRLVSSKRRRRSPKATWRARSSSRRTCRRSAPPRPRRRRRPRRSRTSSPRPRPTARRSRDTLPTAWREGRGEARRATTRRT